jgi:deazaflavin-dependent oxidoreductase (nitroreductase family)
MSLHPVMRLIHPVQRAIVRLLRSYFARASGWVIVTTRGRRTGLPREVLLPCARSGDAIVVVSAYGRRADWFRNLARDPRITVTSAGRVLAAHAHVVDDLAAKQAIFVDHPVWATGLVRMPEVLVFTVLWPLVRAGGRRFVRTRPLVVMRLDASEADRILASSSGTNLRAGATSAG